MSELSAIVNVAIQLNATAVSNQSFNYILLVGPRPADLETWEAATAYTKDDLVVNGANVYKCVKSGTSASTGDGPTGYGSNIVDGDAETGAAWDYVRASAADVGVYATLEEVTEAGWNPGDPIWDAASAVFSQSPKTDKVYIAQQRLVVPQGSTEEEPEDVIDTLARALGTDGWYVICPAGIDSTDYESIAAWTEAQTKLFVYTYTGDTDPISGTIYYRTAGYCGKVGNGKTTPNANNYLGAAAAAKCLSYASGSETWVYKALGGITPSEFTSTQISALEAAYTNWFEEVAGVNVTRGGRVKAGEWIDIIRFRDWLQSDMQYRVLNLLLKNPKIPFTNAGIQLVENQMIASLKAGVSAGGIMPDEYDNNGDLIPGYVVSVPDSSEITASDRAARTLNNCRFEANLAGAIHVVKITGALVYPT